MRPTAARRSISAAASWARASGLQSWAPGAEPILVAPSADSDIKLSALEGHRYRQRRRRRDGRRQGRRAAAGKPGAAPRPRRPSRSPRRRNVSPMRSISRRAAKSSKGQEAVAQVVMNRVFSGYYPNDVCGVVYQNASRHLACQFTFACEGKDLSRDRRARYVGAGQAHRQGHARRQDLARRSRPRHALSRLLGAPELGA